MGRRFFRERSADNGRVRVGISRTISGAFGWGTPLRERLAAFVTGGGAGTHIRGREVCHEGPFTDEALAVGGEASGLVGELGEEWVDSRNPAHRGVRTKVLCQDVAEQRLLEFNGEANT